jgi:ubiquitin C-terminal hydrolase
MAKVKDPVDKNWYEYNDSNVIEINEDKIVDKHAYILFYRQ